MVFGQVACSLCAPFRLAGLAAYEVCLVFWICWLVNLSNLACVSMLGCVCVRLYNAVLSVMLINNRAPPLNISKCMLTGFIRVYIYIYILCIRWLCWLVAAHISFVIQLYQIISMLGIDASRLSIPRWRQRLWITAPL